VNARERLIVALDVPEEALAMVLVDALAGHVGMFKVGSQLFTAAGPDVVRGVVARGGSGGERGPARGLPAHRPRARRQVHARGGGGGLTPPRPTASDR
jgi:Orotidine 5'-phosphate decarboxylase / HUMPS family